MPFELVKTIGETTAPVKFIVRDWSAKDTAAHLKPMCVEFRVTISCEYLNRFNEVIPYDSLLDLVQVVHGAFGGKVVVAEDDPWKDEICGLAGLGVLDAFVVPSVTLPALCALLLAEVDRWLFEVEQNSRVWVNRIEARADGIHAAMQRR